MKRLPLPRKDPLSLSSCAGSLPIFPGQQRNTVGSFQAILAQSIISNNTVCYFLQKLPFWNIYFKKNMRFLPASVAGKWRPFNRTSKLLLCDRLQYWTDQRLMDIFTLLGQLTTIQYEKVGREFGKVAQSCQQPPKESLITTTHTTTIQCGLRICQKKDQHVTGMAMVLFPAIAGTILNLPKCTII